MNALPNPVAVVLIGVFLVLGYWMVHAYFTRPHDQMMGAVGRRPPVGRASEFGQMAGLYIGTLARLGGKISHALVRANTYGQMAGQVIFELDKARRREIMAGFPRGSRRVIWGGSPLLPSGLHNRSMEEVDRPEMRARWAYYLKQALKQFAATVRRPGFLVYTPLGIFVPAAFDPSIILVTVSTGGHLLVAMEAARWLREKFKRAEFYAITILAEERNQRQELVKALELHAANPIFRLWVVGDNLLDRELNDRAMALAVACLSQAHRVTSLAQDPYNLLRNLYPSGDGYGVAVLSYWEEGVGLYPTSLPPIDYFINREDAVRTVLDGIYAMEDKANPAYKCVRLETSLPGTRRIVMVNIALKHEYLVDLQDEIRALLTEEGWFDRDMNRSLIFASLGESLSRSSRSMTVSVLQLEMATLGIDGIKQLVASEQGGQQDDEREDEQATEPEDGQEHPALVPIRTPVSLQEPNHVEPVAAGAKEEPHAGQ